jgi:methyl-accepting chemotaxis protein
MSALSIIGFILIVASVVIVGICYVWVLRATGQITALARTLKNEIIEYGHTTHDVIGQLDQRVTQMNESVQSVTADVTKLAERVKTLEETTTNPSRGAHEGGR